MISVITRGSLLDILRIRWFMIFVFRRWLARRCCSCSFLFRRIFIVFFIFSRVCVCCCIVFIVLARRVSCGRIVFRYSSYVISSISN